eukprot:403341609
MRYFTQVNQATQEQSKIDQTNEPQSETSKPEEKEKPFDYTKMDYYQILEVYPSATEQELKKAYLKLAKRYHPDIYRSEVNKDHFKKVQEAYTTLKNPIKRGDYDKHQRIKHMKTTEDYKQYEKRYNNMGQEFSNEMYEEMKKNAQSQKTVRDTIDPEFEEAFKKLNLNRLFKEFQARPLRSSPDELHENFMQPVQMQKMSKRDKARQKFVREHRDKMLIKRSVSNSIIEQMEFIKDVEEGSHIHRNMNYKQLVEEMNKDLKALEQQERPIMLYKEEKQMMEEVRKKQDESLNTVRKIVYPFWIVAIMVNSILLIGYYYQDKIIEKDAKKISLRDQFKNYRYA